MVPPAQVDEQVDDDNSISLQLLLRVLLGNRSGGRKTCVAQPKAFNNDYKSSCKGEDSQEGRKGFYLSAVQSACGGCCVLRCVLYWCNRRLCTPFLLAATVVCFT